MPAGEQQVCVTLACKNFRGQQLLRAQKRRRRKRKRGVEQALGLQGRARPACASGLLAPGRANELKTAQRHFYLGPKIAETVGH